ncbi:MAG: nucleotide exchange factor GrpE [Bacteroidota bacterium]|nr:nucleotide exchange factor GrpE [Bacteroidota bacterium]
MSKKKTKVEEITEEVKKSKAEEVVEGKSEEVEKKIEETPPSIEELLAIEQDKNLRLFAEFENFRRRTAKERLALLATAGQDIMAILLPILDDMERAIQANEYDEKHGVVLIYNKLKSSLEAKGLREMENPIGKELDTEMHEAISMVTAAKKKQKNKIIDTVEKGYLLGDKVIRHAKVVVAN